MKLVRETLVENERSGPEWEALKKAAILKKQQQFSNTFELIPGLGISKIEFTEDPIEDKFNFEFVSDGNFDNLPQYSEGELIGDYGLCYSFLHIESGNAYYVKKKDIEETPEGNIINVYKVKK